jgi:hypothetical protein
MTGHTKPLRKQLNNVMVWPDVLRVHTCPKVASATINAAFSPRLSALNRTIQSPNEPGPEFRVGFIRHPMDRLVSAWAFFCNSPTDDEISGCASFRAVGYRHGMPLEEFLDIALERHNEEDHTSMQCHWLGDQHFDILAPLHKLDAVWSHLVGMFGFCVKPLRREHIHQSTRSGAVYSSRYMDLVDQEFGRDVQLYQLADSRWLDARAAVDEWAERRANELKQPG